MLARAGRRGMGAVIAVLLAAGTGGLSAALGGHAAASTLTPVVFVGLTATPAHGATITYGDTAVNVTGQLADFTTKAGIAGETITIEFGGSVGGAGNTAIGTATTGADGTFSAAVTLPVAGLVWVKFAGDATYRPINAGAGMVTTTPAATRVTLGALPKLVSAGSRVTLTGKAEVKVGSAWEPLPGATVDGALDASDVSVAGQAITAADGTYSITVTQTDYTGWTAVVEPGAGEFPLYWASNSVPVGVSVIFRTRVSAFAVAGTREAHQSFPFSGVAQVWNGSRWTGYKDLTVTLFHKVQGTAKWVRDWDIPTAASGRFAGSGSLKPGRLAWQARVTGYSAGNKYLASASVTRTIFVTDQTCVVDLFGDRANGRTFVQGWVRDWCGNATVSFGQVKGKAAKLYYRASARASWRLVSQARTDSNGFANFTLDGVLRGYFKITFPAQGYYRSSASKVLHLS